MTDTTYLIVALAIATLSVRLLGVMVGQRLPQHGAWANGLNALPGCLIVSLVCVLLTSGGPREWAAALLALATAHFTKSLPATMAVGIFAIWLLRQVA